MSLKPIQPSEVLPQTPPAITASAPPTSRDLDGILNGGVVLAPKDISHGITAGAGVTSRAVGLTCAIGIASASPRSFALD